jgi:hypothetical protein
VLTDADPAQVQSARNLLASDDTFRVPILVMLKSDSFRVATAAAAAAIKRTAAP